MGKKRGNRKVYKTKSAAKKHCGKKSPYKVKGGYSCPRR